MIKFIDLIDDKNVCKAVSEIGYETPTKIQEKSIPLLKEGRDMIAKSNTGTGKTAAFGLAMMEKLITKEISLGIVVCPTRELALQVHDELVKFSKYNKELKLACVYGGAPIDRQIRDIKRGANIIVGTPGRLMDHMRRKTIKPNTCGFVVLDEADEMLNMGFREDIESILEQINEERQIVLFSATMPRAIKEIAETYTNHAEFVEVKSKRKTVDKITQYYYDVRRDEKNDAIATLIDYYQSQMTIIFCNTKAKVDELVDELSKRAVKVSALHGDIKQEKRTKIMNSFKKASQGILVASDVAARGIDISNIDLVINYDLPQDHEIYIHRIGRTGRAGKEGTAVTLVQSGRQFQQLRGIMKYTHAEIIKKQLPTTAELGAVKRELFKKQVLIAAEDGLIQENIQLANELVKDGMDPQEIINALITLAYGGPVESIEEKKEKRKLKSAVELKFNLGKQRGVDAKSIEHAILGTCNIKKTLIGKIDVRRQYSIVSVEASVAPQVLEMMDKAKVANKRCDVTLYRKSKR